MTPNNAKQARFPRGATVHPNRWGTAPGFSVQLGRATLTCLPGVPAEYRGLAEEVVLPWVAARLGAAPAARVLKLIGLGGVGRRPGHAPGHGRPGPPRRPLRLPGPLPRGPPEVDGRRGPGAEARAAAIEATVRGLFGEAVWGSGKEELAGPGGGAGSPPAARRWRWPRAAPAGCWPRC